MAGLILDELQVRLAASLLYLLTSTVPPLVASTLPPETWESKHQPETLQNMAVPCRRDKGVPLAAEKEAKQTQEHPS